MDLLMWRWKKDDREPYIQLLKRINTIASRDADTFEAQIVTLGQMSTIVQSEDEQKQLLEKLIELTTGQLDNRKCLITARLDK